MTTNQTAVIRGLVTAGGLLLAFGLILLIFDLSSASAQCVGNRQCDQGDSSRGILVTGSGLIILLSVMAAQMSIEKAIRRENARARYEDQETDQ
ncbi:MAG: hypothetical protein U5O16_19795 [Rhodococcus sp. (in: high G+C Gram-positive bacteria)]|uniref:hypothetical protein n=1 Tax=Rhodococcus sp. TaxID=1831 RepID=UPI002AD80B3B|nr:hypothetical protein [Rhodococcus sp. (in: high G+C Gram-positive bacteria)]MDZ7914052.1 hypothetical protein [Rhodococcus sp. (in: high G+C Gram-positive bacteria)]